MKQCSKCKTIKPPNEYYLRKKSRDGHDTVCKQCTRNRHNSYGRTHKFDRYGITQDQYNLMLLSQNGTCKICNKPETRRYSGGIRSLAVDHCHETGQVRGLLCAKCNQGLGSFRDSQELLEAALHYIDSSQNKVHKIVDSE